MQGTVLILVTGTGQGLNACCCCCWWDWQIDREIGKNMIQHGNSKYWSCSGAWTHQQILTILFPCLVAWFFICSQSSFQIRIFHILFLFSFLMFLSSFLPSFLLSPPASCCSPSFCLASWFGQHDMFCCCFVFYLSLVFFIVVGEPRFKRFSSHSVFILYFLLLVLSVLMLQVGVFFFIIILAWS